MKDIDAFVNQLQEKIFDEAREALGDKGFQRWRHPRYNGRLSSPDAHARLTGKCGDTMEIYLKFTADKVTEASYVTDGCASSAICGSFAAELAIGKNPDELTAITGDRVLEIIGKLPSEDRHCADLASETLQAALGNYMSSNKASV